MRRTLSHMAPLLVFFALSAMSTVRGASEPSPTGNPPLPGALQELKGSVGEVLPADFEVIDAQGKAIKLATRLKGPAILFKIKDGCPPCEELLGVVREQGTAGAVQFVVLRVGASEHNDLRLPARVEQFHVVSQLHDGFLGGRLTPTTFYFDQSLRLKQRKPGLPVNPRSLLAFPEAKAP